MSKTLTTTWQTWCFVIFCLLTGKLKCQGSLVICQRSHVLVSHGEPVQNIPTPTGSSLTPRPGLRVSPPCRPSSCPHLPCAGHHPDPATLRGTPGAGGLPAHGPHPLAPWPRSTWPAPVWRPTDLLLPGWLRLCRLARAARGSGSRLPVAAPARRAAGGARRLRRSLRLPLAARPDRLSCPSLQPRRWPFSSLLMLFQPPSALAFAPSPVG